MDKRLTQTLLITFVFVIGYMFFVSKNAPKQELPFQAPAIEQKAILQKEEIPLGELEKLSEATMGNFVINYSSRGGY
ncbi:MAG: hypothetical protein WC412_05145, partial [Candidatus Omnitrophota bacterium]